MQALQLAIQRADGQTGLAKALGVRQGQVWCWINRDGRTPERHCPDIERLYGVPCEQLRPDIRWTRGTDGQITGYHVPVSLLTGPTLQQPSESGA